MKDIDIVIEICGSAGEGTISAGEILSRFMSGQGFEIMSFDSYPAEIRGFGKCVAHTRISSNPIYSPGKLADVLISLNDNHAISQLPTLKESGILIYDSQPARPHEEDKSVAGRTKPGMISYGIPLNMLAHKAAGNARGMNMVALGALSALFHVDKDRFTDSIKARYGKKKQVVIDANVNSFLEGYDWAKENIKKSDPYSFEGVNLPEQKEKLIVNGNQLVAQAALDANLMFYAGYPITPATKIMEILSKELPKHGGTLLQTEDEIAAIGAVIGAGFGGKRAMTATSGPGFALMTEFTGLSVMAEVPAVIIDSQRAGPSTGMPTKTEQSDFNSAVMGGTGDCPRIVLAPADTKSCYEATVLALYFAEKYQTLVVVLLDFFLSNSIKNIDVPKKPAKKYRIANIAPKKEDLKDYKRYKITKSGISPRAVPGTPGGIFFSTGLEHNEYGRPDYSQAGHLKMTQKRYDKFNAVLVEAPAPEISAMGRGKVDIGVISWGSSAGAAREAVMAAQKEGIKAASFSSMMVSPFPEKALIKFADNCRKILIPELNFSGQFADFATCILKRPVEKLNFITGRPMASEDILQKMREM
ncbi:MAG: 2-oxoacid:acceptor oxidoreductase subunit alpha [Proteobacteria bacterium]|nr:2-oxoacid:acceptor oxidoreductase subunit alpha [Pseudomonadota bacterium]MBU1586151.1 2-oxoacid:acceptor oxidoreductase subunit alpha [Pseudomonadota bacterium]MBU2627628.1 2-oxoacid:acceptor oxidoreductase subunit alpha [Pseudomonadota bacterium]